MYLKTLSITQFRNFPATQFQFSPHLNFLTGENGSGKTNALDVIHYLCLGKSYFHNSDQQAVKHETTFFRIEGDFLNQREKHLITCVFALNGKKELSRNNVLYPRLTDHVGLIPAVMITPDDNIIIDDGSDERRRFIDSTLSQIDHQYLEDLVGYNKVLLQRNALLKQFSARKSFDASLIETLDEQLAAFGRRIFGKRELYLRKMTPLIEEYYAVISGKKERVSGRYDSVFHRTDLLTALKKSIDKDRVLERTTEGIHRDEFDFFLNDLPFKKYGSQGQKKSFLMSLKLSQCELIKKEINKTPLLLLDDLFDKLDENRSERILKLIAEDSFGQVFITETNTSRIHDFIVSSKKEHKSFHIQDGSLATGIPGSASQ